MPCPEPGSKVQGMVKALLASTALGLAGCGGQLGSESPPDRAYVSPGSRLLATMLGMHPAGAANNATAQEPQNRHISCPQIFIREEATSNRIYAGSPATSENLRYQSALTDTARECALEGDALTIKIGAVGNVLLGPAGSAGTFTVPIRMSILRKKDDEPVVSKLYRAEVTIPQGQTEAEYTIISEPLRVPFVHEHTDEDYTIKIGIAEGAEPGQKKPRQAGKQ